MKAESFLEAVEQSLRQRRRGDVVRLELEAESERQCGAASGHARAGRAAGHLSAGRARSTSAGWRRWRICRDTTRCRFPPRQPVTTISPDEQADIFATLDSKDILLHHPYESFDPVVAFVEAAADDPDVLAIKQTLYRTSGDSPIVAALTRAADAGKQVTVLVELMARFDESRNIRWARRLEEMGAHVIYGIRHYKVHSKICLVVRRTRAGLARYVHLGTGNYNDRTARLYTDMGLLTGNAQIGADASAFWSALTGYSDPPRLNKLVMAPTMLRERLIALIDRERRRAESGQPARIRAKMNSLIDADIVRALYRASNAGVDIELNVRGMCTLTPGVKGMSDRITVTSIVGRYLEHARVFVFHNGGDEEVYLASADWMGAESGQANRADVSDRVAGGQTEGARRSHRPLPRQRQGQASGARRRLACARVPCGDRAVRSADLPVRAGRAAGERGRRRHVRAAHAASVTFVVRHAHYERRARRQGCARWSPSSAIMARPITPYSMM